MKSEMEKLGYQFDFPNNTKMGCELIGMKEYEVIIHHVKDYSYCIYEFKEEAGAEEYFRTWSDYYKEVSESKYEENQNLRYKKCEQNVAEEGYYYVVIKKENLVFWATVLWKAKNELLNLLLEVNYFK